MKKFYLSIFFIFITNILIAQVNWEYPVKPGSEKWKSLATTKEMVDACRIPISILKKMSTSELLKAYEEFPFKYDVLAFEPIQQTFEMQKEICDALKSLLSKDDAGVIVLKRYRDAIAVGDQIYNKLDPANYYDYLILKLLLSQPEITSKISDSTDIKFIGKELDNYNIIKKPMDWLDIETPRGTPIPNHTRTDGMGDPDEG